MQYPLYRPRRLRKEVNLRRLIRETHLCIDNLVMPYFIRAGKDLKKPISSMPGNFQISVDNLLKELKEIRSLRIPAILLFGIPSRKDRLGSRAYAKDGIIQKAIRAIKKEFKELVVISDVCLCEYTDHGHCGVIKDGLIDNDATLELMAKVALSHAQAGVDIVAPSGMADGQVRSIREALDKNGYQDIAIMSYSAKYASNFYGPFREAAESPPKFGDRASYQMDAANSDEALREVALDIQEGADVVMVKPALAYLDIISQVKERFRYPLAAYNVSGEFAMVKAAAEKGWMDERRVILEILTGIKRAGADIIISYHAKDVARWLAGKRKY